MSYTRLLLLVFLLDLMILIVILLCLVIAYAYVKRKFVDVFLFKFKALDDLFNNHADCLDIRSKPTLQLECPKKYIEYPV